MRLNTALSQRNKSLLFYNDKLYSRHSFHYKADGLTTSTYWKFTFCDSGRLVTSDVIDEGLGVERDDNDHQVPLIVKNVNVISDTKHAITCLSDRTKYLNHVMVNDFHQRVRADRNITCKQHYNNARATDFPPVPINMDDFREVPEDYSYCNGQPSTLLFDRYNTNYLIE